MTSNLSSEHVIIPRTENTIKCMSRPPLPLFAEHWLRQAQDINSELDELDREEFYRLKKVANKKQRDNAAQDAEMKARQAEHADKENAEPDNQSGPADILAAEGEEDVIF